MPTNTISSGLRYASRWLNVLAARCQRNDLPISQPGVIGQSGCSGDGAPGADHCIVWDNDSKPLESVTGVNLRCRKWCHSFLCNV